MRHRGKIATLDTAYYLGYFCCDQHSLDINKQHRVPAAKLESPRASLQASCSAVHRTRCRRLPLSPGSLAPMRRAESVEPSSHSCPSCHTVTPLTAKNHKDSSVPSLPFSQYLRVQPGAPPGLPPFRNGANGSSDTHGVSSNRRIYSQPLPHMPGRKKNHSFLAQKGLGKVYFFVNVFFTKAKSQS